MAASASSGRGSKSTSRTKRAGLHFTVGRVQRHFKSTTGGRVRVGVTAAVYAAAVLEYLTAELVELAGKATSDLRVRRITPRHLQLAIRADDDLDSLVRATVPGGGVIPHVHKSLVVKKGPERAELPEAFWRSAYPRRGQQKTTSDSD